MISMGYIKGNGLGKTNTGVYKTPPIRIYSQNNTGFGYKDKYNNNHGIKEIDDTGNSKEFKKRIREQSKLYYENMNNNNNNNESDSDDDNSDIINNKKKKKINDTTDDDNDHKDDSYIISEDRVFNFLNKEALSINPLRNNKRRINRYKNNSKKIQLKNIF
mmetsp:Transcript_27101/g.35143  ORF Transcript_27101/g.35143 Transcript_27101/m.35143 type:complete len:161 (+) Transcript_27101:394-876(+)